MHLEVINVAEGEVILNIKFPHDDLQLYFDKVWSGSFACEEGWETRASCHENEVFTECKLSN